MRVWAGILGDGAQYIFLLSCCGFLVLPSPSSPACPTLLNTSLTLRNCCVSARAPVPVHIYLAWSGKKQRRIPPEYSCRQCCLLHATSHPHLAMHSPRLPHFPQPPLVAGKIKGVQRVRAVAIRVLSTLHCVNPPCRSHTPAHSYTPKHEAGVLTIPTGNIAYRSMRRSIERPRLPLRTGCTRVGTSSPFLVSERDFD